MVQLWWKKKKKKKTVPLSSEFCTCWKMLIKFVPRLLEGQIIQVYETEVLFYLVSCSFDVVLGQYILML